MDDIESDQKTHDDFKSEMIAFVEWVEMCS